MDQLLLGVELIQSGLKFVELTMISRYVLLEYNPFKCFSKLKESLKFTPHAFGLNYKIITPKFVNKSHKENIEVFAWTVNEIEMSNELIKIGVDAIITDYPNLIKHE